MIGNVTRRGKHSWRLKFDVGRDPQTGVRLTRYVTVRGTKKDAQAELTRLLASRDSGTFVEPSKVTLGEYLETWVAHAEAAGGITPKTAERYAELIRNQIAPHLGSVVLQKLRPAAIADWHTMLLREGGAPQRRWVVAASGERLSAEQVQRLRHVEREGDVRTGVVLDGASRLVAEERHCRRPLDARTVLHAHRLLTKALSDAVRRELVTRNVAAVVKPPSLDGREVQILERGRLAAVIAAVRGTPLYAPVFLFLTAGLRRGELMALQWRDLDLDGGKLRIARSVEKTRAGLRIKAPKTSHGTRTIALAASTVAVLREHRAEQSKLRLALGIGRASPESFIFGDHQSELRDPDWLTWEWRRFAKRHGFAGVTLHALRHTHASALIASGLDPVTVSRRLGHGDPSVTLKVYSHLFARTDEAAADAIDAMLAESLGCQTGANEAI